MTKEEILKKHSSNYYFGHSAMDCVNCLSAMEEYAQQQLAPSSEKELWGKGFDTGLTIANNICMRRSDDYNADDYIEQAAAANDCAKEIRGCIGDRSYFPEKFPPDVATDDDWISVEDRLPEYGQEVLVWGEAKGMNPQMGGAYPFMTKRVQTGNRRMVDENQFYAAYVTHWQKPKPPKQ